MYSTRKLSSLFAIACMTIIGSISSAAYVTINSKSYSAGSTTITYNSNECTVGYWKGAQSLSGDWYEFGATFGASLIANTVPGETQLR